jgi:CTP synthase
VDHELNYIFITGGVISSLGKGITASTTGLLLEKLGKSVVMLKIDPYLNVDPGTMSPYQHGEVYVTDDGAETDLDLGHYFRFTNTPLSRLSSFSSGQIYEEILKKERRGEYLGQTVQIIPHVTEEIKGRIQGGAEQLKQGGFAIVELGGTAGDIESVPFMEAIRQFRNKRKGRCLHLHVTYVPYMEKAGERKTKPTQHSVQTLRQYGMIPDLILCRSESALTDAERAKIALFCDVEKEYVYNIPDVASAYLVPEGLVKQGFTKALADFFHFEDKEISLEEWQKCTNPPSKIAPDIRIGLVGKYINHRDSYLSICEALKHASISLGYNLILEPIDPEHWDEYRATNTPPCDGYLLPGGFGVRGWEGKIQAARFCRENKIPYFGICLGMQVLAVEFALNVLSLKEANSTEFAPETEYPVISLLSEQKNVENLGGTMRLGAYQCQLTPGTKAFQAYGQEEISERHRHRYEFNNEYKALFEKNGARIAGVLARESLCEIMEIENHPWMVGVQFHPEFISKPTKPHPLFTAFFQAAYTQKNSTQGLPKE